MRPKRILCLLLLLLLTAWTSTRPPWASSALASSPPAHPEVFPISWVYRQQIEEQITFPPQAFAGPRPVDLALPPTPTGWLAEEHLAGRPRSDPLDTQMSLQR
jgi:hypothetical protein